MALFGFGGGRSESRSTGSSESQSSSFGRSDQGSRGRSVSGGFSRSGNEAFSRARDVVAFEDVFERLYGNASSAAAGLDPNLLTSASNQLFSGGLDFMQSIGADAGTGFLEDRLASADALEAEQISQLQSDLGDLFRNELLPGIQDEAIAGYSLGGGRQGVAEGVAAGEIADSFSRGAVDIQTRNRAMLDEVAAGIAQRNVAGAGTALSAIPSLYGIADAGFGASLRGSQLLSGILGGPTVLGRQDSASYGFSTAADFARAFSDSFGRSRSGSQSTSRSQTESTSDSFNIGFRPFTGP